MRAAFRKALAWVCRSPRGSSMRMEAGSPSAAGRREARFFLSSFPSVWNKRGMPSASIWVVDDEPQLRRVMRATLTDLGYIVIDAKSGEEAIEKFRQESPDLVLLDLNMPGIGGLETCR